jgi:hypothetical protein
MVSPSATALLDRHLASAGTSRGSCHSEGHHKRDSVEYIDVFVCVECVYGLFSGSVNCSDSIESSCGMTGG